MLRGHFRRGTVALNDQNEPSAVLRQLAVLKGRIVSMLQHLAERPRTVRRNMAIAMDAVLCVIAAWAALWLRIGDWQFFDRSIAIIIACALAFWFPIAWARRTYSSLIRFAGGRTMAGIGVTCAYFAVPMLLVLMVLGVPGVPRTMGLLHPIIFLALLTLSRLVIRFALIDILGIVRGNTERRRVAIYGAGRAGQQLALAMRHEPHVWLVAFFDDDRRLNKQLLDGVPVFETGQLDSQVEELQLDEVLLAIPSASRARRREIVERITKQNIKVRALPSVGGIIDGDVSVNDLREVEVDELLGRDPVAPNSLLMCKNIVGRSVMVTGAGGSIGSELCRQILGCRPTDLVLVEQSELALYQIERELAQAVEQRGLETRLWPQLCDVADKGSVTRVFQRHRPDTVYHAAAYKHVPLVEANPISGLHNNVFGTLNCCLAAEDVGVAHFILVSTDKAVRPTNVMGSSKRICELVLQARAREAKGTVFSMVRFGNVLGSSGSVVPLFKEQIRRGGPVTLTDHRVTRFFMTVPEASQLVIQAGAMAKGGEVFLLDMGQPVLIYDLAVAMIRLCGLSVCTEDNPDGDIEIREVGLRQGEKLYEELLIGNNPKATAHPRIIHSHESMIPWAELSQRLEALAACLTAGDAAKALAIMTVLVPEYQPTPTTVQQPQVGAA
jgi:FlaA1/EpsC-like NDP-sugar epimerase